MSKLSNKAFAIMAVCEKTKEHFGITVDPRNGCYAFTWAFKIKKEQAKKEGYEQTHVTGKVMYDKVQHFFSVRRKYSKLLMNVRLSSFRGMSSRRYTFGTNSHRCLYMVR